MFNLLFACTNTPNFHGLPRVFSRIKQDNLDTFSLTWELSWLARVDLAHLSHPKAYKVLRKRALESKCCQISEHFYIEAEQVHKGG